MPNTGAYHSTVVLSYLYPEVLDTMWLMASVRLAMLMLAAFDTHEETQCSSSGVRQYVRFMVFLVSLFIFNLSVMHITSCCSRLTNFASAPLTPKSFALKLIEWILSSN